MVFPGDTPTFVITYSPVAPSPAPNVTVNGNPTTINNGQTTTITWSSTNAVSCSAPWTASTATSGSQVVSPAVTTTYTMTCVGPGGTGSASDSVVITVNGGGSGPSTIDYSLTSTPVNIVQGQTGQSTITETLLSGTSESVTLTASNLPSGITSVSYPNQGCSPTCIAFVTIDTGGSVTPGTYPITVTGVSAISHVTKSTVFQLTINAASTLSVVCDVNPSPVQVNHPATWNATVTGALGPVTYQWYGSDFPTGPNTPTTNPYVFSYQTTGAKDGFVIATDSVGSRSAACANTQLNVNVQPVFQEF
jgi:hypothetical protein